jgi:hypothetical protein
MANKTAKRESKRRLEELLEERGIKYTNPSGGVYRIKGADYFYWAKGVPSGGAWHYFESHTAFLNRVEAADDILQL